MSAWMEAIADEAQGASDKADFHALYAIVKRLKSGHETPHRAIRHESGEVLCEPSEVDDRWKRHWASLFAGSLASYGELC
eukprot:7914077-Heterocapsa_arctica.AAC.1